jgi:hypothetical protein
VGRAGRQSALPGAAKLSLTAVPAGPAGLSRGRIHAAGVVSNQTAALAAPPPRVRMPAGAACLSGHPGERAARRCPRISGYRAMACPYAKRVRARDRTAQLAPVPPRCGRGHVLKGPVPGCCCSLCT